MKSKRMKSFVIIALVLPLLVGCAQSKLTRNKVDFGVVFTSDNIYKTEILWLDKNIDNCQRRQYHYAALGTHFNQVVDDGKELYLIPEGIFNTKDTKKVVSFNKETLALSEYPFEHIALNCTAVINDNVYAVNTLNDINYIEKYNMKTKESSQYKQQGDYFESIIAVDDKLFTIVKKDNGLKDVDYNIYLYVFSKDLVLEKNIDITKFGQVNDKYYQDDENIYFTVGLDSFDNKVGRILKISKKDYHIDVMPTKEKMPFDIYFYNDKFIITHFDPVSCEGTKVSIIDKEGNEKIYNLHMGLCSTGIYDGKLIVAGKDKIALFSIKDNMKKVAEKEYKISDDLYLSNILLVGNNY